MNARSVPPSAAEIAEVPEYSVVLAPGALGFLMFTVAATIVAVAVIDRAATVFVLLGAAITTAVIVAPMVEFLSRRLPRAVAIVVVTLVGMIGIVAVVGLIARDLEQQESALRSALHQAIADLDPNSRIADLAENLRLDERIDRALDGAAARVVLGERDPIYIAGELGKVVIVGVLAAFMIAGGGRLVQVLIRFVRRTSIREQLTGALDSAAHRAGSFLRRTLVVSAAHGVVGAVIVRALDLPGPTSLGAWLAVMSTVPILGAAVGWAPIVVLGSVHGVSLAVLILVALSAMVADRVMRARWVHGALRVGPLLTVLGVAVGVTMSGISGAILGLFVVSFIAAVLSHRGHLAAAISDLVEDPVDRSLPTAVDGVPVEDEPDERDEGDEGGEGGEGGAQDRPFADPLEADLDPVLSEQRGGRRIVRLRLSGRTAASAATLIALAVALLKVLSSIQAVVVWLAVAGFIAAGLDRPISAMHRRWRLPRVAGTTLMLGSVIAAVAAVVLIGGSSITNSTETIAEDAPETVRSMESLPIVGTLLERNGAVEKVEDFINSVPERLRDSEVVDRIAQAAGDGIVGAFWIVAILLAILWDGPRLATAVRLRVPVEKRQRTVRFGRAAYTAVSNVVAAAAFVAALNGTVVMTLAIVLGIPLAPILGLWAASWNFIPQIGGFIGAVPLVALSFGQGPWQGMTALVVFVIYQTFENHVIQPVVGSRAVHLPPLVVMVGALFGGVLAGFVGALLAGPTLGVAKIALDEFRHDSERIEDRRDHLPSSSVEARAAPPAASV